MCGRFENNLDERERAKEAIGSKKSIKVKEYNKEVVIVCVSSSWDKRI